MAPLDQPQPRPGGDGETDPGAGLPAPRADVPDPSPHAPERPTGVPHTGADLPHPGADLERRDAPDPLGRTLGWARVGGGLGLVASVGVWFATGDPRLTYLVLAGAAAWVAGIIARGALQRPGSDTAPAAGPSPQLVGAAVTVGVLVLAVVVPLLLRWV